MHHNISETDLVSYSDFSKNLETPSQEQCKSEMYVASNQTIQLLGQVLELKVLPSGPPVKLEFDEVNQKFSFDEPLDNGGSRIQVYEIHISQSDCWFYLLSIKVMYLSSIPAIPEELFGRLGGQFKLRVYSRNLSGVGDYSEIIVNLAGAGAGDS